MAYQRYGQHDKSYICDTHADLASIKDPNGTMGSTCFVIDEAVKYMLNSKGEWIRQAPAAASPVTPDLSSYATISYVDSEIDAIEIPSVEGLASVEYVAEAVAAVEIPSVEGLASETYVDEAVAAINPIQDGYGDEHAFGLMVNANENRTLVEAMRDKGSVGMYNFHVQKGSPGQPDDVVAKNSSCRGIACVDTYRSDDNWYGWILMFDQDGETYVQYIRNAEPKGWKKLATV